MVCPKKEIDWELVDRKLKAGCTGVEIASCLGIHPDTLYIRTQDEKGIGFSDYSQQKKAAGDSSIREAQFNKAIEGDNTMLIWLGKNRLKQSESPQEISVNADTLKNFNDLMGQISSLQSSRNIAESISNKE